MYQKVYFTTVQLYKTHINPTKWTFFTQSFFIGYYYAKIDVKSLFSVAPGLIMLRKANLAI
ncbi:MAG: hypothetical protein ACKOXB_09935 [Flavobacteriales bacterium]